MYSNEITQRVPHHQSANSSNISFWDAEHPIENQTIAADVIQTCQGPKSMLKKILDPMGGIM